MVRRREILGCLCAVVLLWFITIARLVLDFCTSDFSAVFLYEGCIGWGTVTVFVGCMMEVVLGSWFLQKYFLPMVFGKLTWDAFDTLKQQKLVGFFAQIVVRSACAVQLGTILFGGWGQQYSLGAGLFAEHNAKASYRKLIETGEVTTCAHMEPSDVVAFRAWYFSKYHMMAVHIWELSFIPGLPLDAWLHHLFVIAVAAVCSSPDTVTTRPEVQPFIDSIGFSFIIGASLNCFVKLCVVMYHHSAPAALRQARWMEASIAGAAGLLLVFYFLLPCIVTFWHAKELGLPTFLMCLALIFFLCWVEIRLIIVKRSIARYARRKAADMQATPAELSLAEGVGSGSFQDLADSHVRWSWISVGPLRLPGEDGADGLEESAKEARC